MGQDGFEGESRKPCRCPPLGLLGVCERDKQRDRG